MSEDHIWLIDYAEIGQVGAMRQLLSERQIDVNKSNEYGINAALVAAERNDLEMLKLLVEHGARLDVKDGMGRTPIGWAERNENAEMIEYCRVTFKNDI